MHEEKIKELKQQIAVLQQQIVKLQQEEIDAIDKKVDKFLAWANSDIPNKEHRFIHHFTSSRGTDLISAVYDDSANRYETITVQDIAVRIEDFLHDETDADGSYWDYSHQYKRFNISELYEWMDLLMQDNFKSMVYDW